MINVCRSTRNKRVCVCVCVCVICSGNNIAEEVVFSKLHFVGWCFVNNGACCNVGGVPEEW